MAHFVNEIAHTTFTEFYFLSPFICSSNNQPRRCSLSSENFTIMPIAKIRQRYPECENLNAVLITQIHIVRFTMLGLLRKTTRIGCNEVLNFLIITNENGL